MKKSYIKKLFNIIKYYWMLIALLTFGVGVAECGRPHVAQSDGALAAAVHKLIAVPRMELCRSYHLSQLLHVARLDVNYIEGLQQQNH